LGSWLFLLSAAGGLAAECPQVAIYYDGPDGPPACSGYVTPCYKNEFMAEFILSILAAVRVFFRSRHDTAIEILALRRQAEGPR